MDASGDIPEAIGFETTPLALAAIIEDAKAQEPAAGGGPVLTVAAPKADEAVEVRLAEGQQLRIEGVAAEAVTVIALPDGLVVSVSEGGWLFLPDAPVAWTGGAEGAGGAPIPVVTAAAGAPTPEAAGETAARHGGGADFTAYATAAAGGAVGVTGPLSPSPSSPAGGGAAAGRLGLIPKGALSDGGEMPGHPPGPVPGAGGGGTSGGQNGGEAGGGHGIADGDQDGGGGAGNARPVARDDAATTDEDTRLRFNVVANDTDADGGRLRLVAARAEGFDGRVTFDAEGNVAFDPRGAFDHLRVGESATVVVRYTVADPQGAMGEAAATIVVAGVNDRPDPLEDNVHTLEDTAKTFRASVLSGDDFDAEGDPLKVIAVHHAEHGTVVL
ncbi:MAG: cadherin-like domain-containing protein, partial [Geminicoccaceae bacterium]|nr:cadherin-like domain-containing protein [Geminicoccaceae bacterium]